MNEFTLDLKKKKWIKQIHIFNGTGDAYAVTVDITTDHTMRISVEPKIVRDEKFKTAAVEATRDEKPEFQSFG